MSHERPSKEIKYMPHISLQSNIQAFKKLTVIFPQPSQMKCKVEKRLSPRDPKCGFYRTVWTSVSQTFERNSVLRNVANPDWKDQRKYKTKRSLWPIIFLQLVNRLRTHTHFLSWARKEGLEWNRRPRTIICWPWDQIIECTAFVMLNFRNVPYLMSTFSFLFLSFGRDDLC